MAVVAALRRRRRLALCLPLFIEVNKRARVKGILCCSAAISALRVIGDDERTSSTQRRTGHVTGPLLGDNALHHLSRSAAVFISCIRLLLARPLLPVGL